MKYYVNAISIIGLLSIPLISHSGEITDTYADGDTLTTTILDNIKSAVNDNHADVGTNATKIDTNSSAISDHESRIDALETPPGAITRTISIPAGALSFNPTSTVIEPHGAGLSWTQSFASAASVYIEKPEDYAGGDITMSLFFRTTTATAGVVAFFTRPNSFDSGEGFVDSAGISNAGVSVSGTLGFGTLYEQTFTIPAARMTKDWWNVRLQREGAASTYPDSVILLAVSLEYTASH